MITCTGASYNVFNGEEHLVQSVRNIRPCVDYINIVVQYISNQGLPAQSTLRDAIDELSNNKLVDEIIEYTPDFGKTPVENELEKRNIGLFHAKKASVSHFITMDSDEFYPRDEFDQAKFLINLKGYQSTSVHTYLHIKRPIYRSAIPDTTCCSFLTKIESESMIHYDDYYPVVVDPTRRLHGRRESFHQFSPETVSMRHMNLVRRDLAWKLKNSTNAQATEFMQRVQKAFEDWQFGDLLNFPNKPPLQIIQVDDLFDLDSRFRGS